MASASPRSIEAGSDAFSVLSSTARHSPAVGTPLSRAGLLSSSYQSSVSFGHHHVVPHARTDIRASTMHLSAALPLPPLPPSPAPSSNTTTPDLVFPRAPSRAASSVHHNSHNLQPSSVPEERHAEADLESSVPSIDTLGVRGDDDDDEEALTPIAPNASNLTILLARHSSRSRSRSPPEGAVDVEAATPRMAPAFILPPSPPPPIIKPANGRPHLTDETTPLLPSRPFPAAHPHLPPLPPSSSSPPPPSQPAALALTSPSSSPSRSKVRARATRALRSGVRDAGRWAKVAVGSVPAVVLGTLLNVLDGVSYGMIIFPASGVFADLGAMGVTMFFVTTFISQVIYSAGASGFAGVNGSMMIEVVPFYHLLAQSIESRIGEDDPRAVIATTLIAFALSSLLTGLTFFALGFFRLGNLIGFFPRHILVGCIGGVGVFLFITGLTVSLRLTDDAPLDLHFAKLLFAPESLPLWMPALGLAVLLRVITARWHGQLILPAYFIFIPAVFYVVVAAARLDLSALREGGWLFDVGTSSHEEVWWKFYTYFDFGKTHWSAIAETMPTQFALLFFNILHPPLNVPALAVSLDHDVDTNAELVAHGYSNLAAGLLGTPPNYIVYVNTLLFYRVGGTTRLAGLMLAGATAVLLTVGTWPIAYIPVMVVSALIFVLGYDLMKEALWDTRHRVSRSEYITIVCIMVAMTVWDFVSGVFFGIVVSCFFFVVQSSQRRAIRAVVSGPVIMSTVRRPSAHRDYLRAVSAQTTVLRLQGFLFFGTIARVEDVIRSLVEAHDNTHTNAQTQIQAQQVRFLVVDLAMVAGVDMSAAEAFVRIRRLLNARAIVLVFCGVGSGDVARSLESVGLFELEDVELFATLDEAMEWTENVYLRSWFSSSKAETQPAVVLPGRDITRDLMLDVASTPRRNQLQDAGQRTMGLDPLPAPPAQADTDASASDALLNTLAQAFSSFGPLDRTLFSPLPHFFTRISLGAGTTLWRTGDRADALYAIEAGVLRATYSPGVGESMVPGTLAGEMSALTEGERNATVVVERDAVLWKLEVGQLRRMERERPEIARALVALLLRAARIEYDILLTTLATRVQA